MDPLRLNHPPLRPINNPAVIDTAIRRRLQAELTRIGDLIAETHFDDAMTRRIGAWRERFFNSLRLNINVEVIQAEFIGLLQEFLVDPSSQTPVDEEAILGSDGRTYSNMTITLYNHSAPEALRGRSPLEPENAARFTYVPHPIVRHMTRWLSDHGALLRSEETERRYRELMDQIPPARQNDIVNRVRLIRERAQRQQERNQPPIMEGLQQAAAELAQTIQPEFAPVHQLQQQGHEERMQQPDRQPMAQLQDRVELMQQGATGLNQRSQRLNDQIDNIGTLLARRRERIQRLLEGRYQRDQEGAEQLEELNRELLQNENQNTELLEQQVTLLQNRVQRHRENNAASMNTQQLNDREQREILEARIQQLTAESARLEAETQQLHTQIGRVDRAINDAQRADAQLQIAINETRKEINDRKARDSKSFLNAIVMIGVCAFATWAIGGVLSASGSAVKGAVIPSDGVVKLGFSIAF